MTGLARAPLLLFALPLLAGGCSLLPGSGDAEREAKILEDRLEVFQYRYIGLLTQAAMRIETETEDVGLRKSALFMQLIVPPHARDAVYRAEDPLSALMDVWALARQTREYFDGGPGAAEFGELVRYPLEAARTLETEASELALEILGPERHESAAGVVERFCAKYPPRSPFSRESIQGFLKDESNELNLDWFFDTSLSPLRAIGGLDKTAIAVHEVARSADEMTSVVNAMPNRVRLQTQLLMYDLAAQPAIGSVLASVDRVSTSAERLTGLAEALPERVRAEVQTALDEIEAVRPGLEQTIRELRATLEELTRSLTAATGTTEGVGRAGEALEGALVEFRGVLTDLGGDEEAPPPPSGVAPADSPVPVDPTAGTPTEPAPPGKPFDIEDYTRTAEAIALAADSLRGTLAELRATIDTLESSRTVETSAAEVEGIARTLTLLALALFAGCAAVVLGARIIARRLARHASEAKSRQSTG